MKFWTLLFAVVFAASPLIVARHAVAAEEKKAGEWEKLGEAKVGKKEERDVIDVVSKNRFTAITFKAAEGDIAIEDVKITFEDDSTFSPETKLVFREGQRSQKIDLPGKERAIKHIRFLYRAVGRGAAVIEVEGKIGK